MKIFSKNEVRNLILIAIILISITIGFHLIFGPGDKKEFVTTTAVKEISEDSAKILYNNSFAKLYNLNIGETFIKDSLFAYIVDNKFYGIWVEIKSILKESCMYEIKGKESKSNTM